MEMMMFPNVEVLIQFTNGEEWAVKALPIAYARADYYATKIDGHAKGSPEYLKEVEYALTDGLDDLMDYAQNNMDWADFLPYARRVTDPAAFNYQAELGEAEWSAKTASPKPAGE